MNMFEKLLVAFKSDGFWIHFARFGIVGTIIHIHGAKAENGTSGKVDAITLHLDSSRRRRKGDTLWAAILRILGITNSCYDMRRKEGETYAIHVDHTNTSKSTTLFVLVASEIAVVRAINGGGLVFVNLRIKPGKGGKIQEQSFER